MEDNVAGLEVVVDDLLWQRVEVLQSAKNLFDYKSGLRFSDASVVFDVLGKLRSHAILKLDHCTFFGLT